MIRRPSARDMRQYTQRLSHIQARRLESTLLTIQHWNPITPILIAVLRDMSTPRLAQKRNYYLCEEGDPDRGTLDRYRLVTRPQDKSFFEKAIQVQGATSELNSHPRLEESKRHFVQNASILKAELETMTEAERDRLVAFLIQRCFLVVISVTSVDTAHRVFRVLNTRGLDLAPTDILKAELLESIQPTDQEQAARIWESFETILGRDKFVDLFNHIRMIYQREKPRERLEVSFSRHVDEFKRSPDKFLNETLASFAHCFADILESSRAIKHFGLKVEKYLTYLRRLDNSDWIPCALLFLSMGKNEKENIDFIATLERCAYFLFVCRYNINDRIGRYAKAIAQIQDGKDFRMPDFALHLKNKEKKEWLRVLDGPIYEMTRVRMPLLLRLDSMLSDGAAEYNHDIVTVEHVIPQNPKKDSAWITLFKDEDERWSWIHALGNLVLLPHTKNVRAGNLEFERKKNEYFRSKDGANTFALTSTLLQEASFSIEVLEKRHSFLLNRLRSGWQLQSEK